MSKRNIVLILIGAAALIIIAGSFWYRTQPPRYDLKVGKKYSYTLTYKQESAALISVPDGEASSFSGLFSCALDLNLTPIERTDTGYTIALTMMPNGDCSFQFAGKDLFSDPALLERTFDKRFALIAMQADGRIAKIRVRKGEDALFRGVLKLILGDIQTVLTATGDRSWQTTESNQYGSYHADYTLSSRFWGGPRVIKKKGEYLSLLAVPRDLDRMTQQSEGVFTIDFARSGHPERLSGIEKLTVTAKSGAAPLRLNTEIRMDLRSIASSDEEFSLGDAGAGEELILGRVEIDEAKRRELLEKRADNLTGSEMAGLIREYALGPEADGANSPGWRVAAYLKLHPEKCAELIPLFTEKEMTSKGRLAVFGVLVSTGTPEAQKVMRDILATEEAKKEGMYSIYLQNFGHLQQPDNETVAFLTAKYEEAKRVGRYRDSTALTLGAMVANLNGAGDAANAARLNGVLLADLTAAKDRHEQELLLDSVGNAAMVSNIEAVAEYLKSPDERIRASVASAVRRTQTEESEKMLFGLARDREALVQKQAVNALAGYKLDKRHLEQVREGIASGGIGTHAYYETLQLLSRQKGNRETVQETLREMKKRAPDDPHLLSRINQMLGR